MFDPTFLLHTILFVWLEGLRRTCHGLPHIPLKAKLPAGDQLSERNAMILVSHLVPRSWCDQNCTHFTEGNLSGLGARCYLWFGVQVRPLYGAPRRPGQTLGPMPEREGKGGGRRRKGRKRDSWRRRSSKPVGHGSSQHPGSGWHWRHPPGDFFFGGVNHSLGHPSITQWIGLREKMQESPSIWW